MIKKLRTYTNLFAAEISRRASVLKMKINGRCVNNCVFCLFHKDSNRLEVQDIANFFNKLTKPRFRRTDINGGEPTIHPHFLEICALLRQRFGGKIPLRLGINLIPLARRRDRSSTFAKRFEAVLDTFDVILVGCDDEHHNIEYLEELGPEIIQAGC